MLRIPGLAPIVHFASSQRDRRPCLRRPHIPGHLLSLTVLVSIYMHFGVQFYGIPNPNPKAATPRPNLGQEHQNELERGRSSTSADNRPEVECQGGRAPLEPPPPQARNHSVANPYSVENHSPNPLRGITTLTSDPTTRDYVPRCLPRRGRLGANLGPTLSLTLTGRSVLLKAVAQLLTRGA